MSRPRIRTIKPDTWADEKIGYLSRDARLLFVVLISLADDEGRLRELPAAILGHGYPYDPDAPALLVDWMRELVGVGLAERYSVDGRCYLTLPGFNRHQVINRPRPSELPPPPGAPLAPAPDGTNHGTVTDASVSAHGTFIAGREGKGKEGIPPNPPSELGGPGHAPGEAAPVNTTARRAPGSPRQRGRSPRQLGERAAAEVRRAQAEVAAAALAPPVDGDRAGWERLRAALRTGAAGGPFELYAGQLELVAAAGGVLVLDAPDETRPWLTARFTRLLQRTAAGAGVSARLASPAEHDGFAIAGLVPA